MASNTPNLRLYKVDPVADGNELFNIDKLLNENWDRIDSNAKNLKQSISSLTNIVNGKAKIVTGRFTVNFNGSYQSDLASVHLGFYPTFVVLYGIENNGSGVGTKFESAAQEHTPRVITREYSNEYSVLTSNGFNAKFSLRSSSTTSLTIYYVAA